MANCKKCRNQIEDSDLFCPRCGSKITEERKNSNTQRKWLSRKVLIYSIVFVFLAGCTVMANDNRNALVALVAGEKQLTDCEKLGLKGSVKSVKEQSEYTADTGSWSSPYSDKSYVFAVSGQLTNEAVTSRDKSVSDKTEYKYDDSNRLIKKTTKNKNSNITKVGTYNYDDGGKVKVVIEQCNIDTYHKYISEITADGLMEVGKWYNTNGEIVGAESFEYNKRGLIVNNSQYYPNGQLKWGNLHRYNDRNQLIEDGVPDHFSTRYKYNYRGFESEKVSSTSGIEYATTSFVAYRYDEKDNWIYREIVFSSKPDNKERTVAVERRTIEYY